MIHEVNCDFFKPSKICTVSDMIKEADCFQGTCVSVRLVILAVEVEHSAFKDKYFSSCQSDFG